MSDDAELSDEDARLFREQVGNVRRVEHDRVTPPGRRPAPHARRRQEDDRQVLKDMMSDDYDAADLETGEELLFARPGLQHTLLRKLRRGQFSLGGELDLHGMTVPVARVALAEFLDHCRESHKRCVRIIHGKGRGSRHRQPILKQKVNKWLAQRDEVLAFCSARPIDGGTGAVYVLLKRKG